MASTTATSSMNRLVEEPAEENLPEGKYVTSQCCLIVRLYLHELQIDWIGKNLV